MEIVIDGHNLLHAWDRAVGPDDHASARRRLLDAIAGYAARSGARAIVVFDGADLPYPRKQVHRGVTVLFSRGPGGADGEIAGLLARSDHARETLVVSTDAAVASAARRAGARTLSSEAFSRELRVRPPAPAPRAEPGQLGEAEVRRWARDFGIDPDTSTPPRRRSRR